MCLKERNVYYTKHATSIDKPLVSDCVETK